MESWYKCNCDKCDRVNWWSNGDENDFTVDDIGGYACWSCGHENIFEGCDGLMDNLDLAEGYQNPE